MRATTNFTPRSKRMPKALCPAFVTAMLVIVGFWTVVHCAADGISLAPTLLGRLDEQKMHRYLYRENGTTSPHTRGKKGRIER